MEQFVKHVTLFPTSKIRIYRTKEGANLVQLIQQDGTQELFKIIIPNEHGLGFIKVGHFSTWFNDRTIYQEELKGKGLGEKALKAFLANKRKEKNKAVLVKTRKKSALIMFLRNGFKLDWLGNEPIDWSSVNAEKIGLEKFEELLRKDDARRINSELIKKFGVKNEAELLKLLIEDKNIPEQLPIDFDFLLVRDLQKPRSN